jgi:Ca2+-binding RTX toxin-like protein
MAIVTVGDGPGEDFGNLNFDWLEYGVLVEATPTLSVIDDRGDADSPSGFLNKVYGSGLTYDTSGGVHYTGGAVTGWDSFVGPAEAKIFSISGLSIPATTVADGMANAGYAAPVLFARDDSMTGGSGADGLWGFDGNDTITGGAGDDSIAGGVPAGMFAAQNSAEWTYGYAFSTADGSNVLRGEAGNDLIQGGGGFDDINGNRGNDTAAGGPGDDLLRGGQGEDCLNGNAGNDTLYGDQGNDTVHGGQGDDVIYAGSGADWLAGDLGANTLYGGEGLDTFRAGAGHDVVNGWHAGDQVQVARGVTWTTSQVNGDMHITFSNGGEMDLIGVQASSLQSGWIVTV